MSLDAHLEGRLSDHRAALRWLTLFLWVAVGLLGGAIIVVVLAALELAGGMDNALLGIASAVVGGACHVKLLADVRDVQSKIREATSARASLAELQVQDPEGFAAVVRENNILILEKAL